MLNSQFEIFLKPTDNLDLFPTHSLLSVISINDFTNRRYLFLKNEAKIQETQIKTHKIMASICHYTVELIQSSNLLRLRNTIPRYWLDQEWINKQAEIWELYNKVMNDDELQTLHLEVIKELFSGAASIREPIINETVLEILAAETKFIPKIQYGLNFIALKIAKLRSSYINPTKYNTEKLTAEEMVQLLINKGLAPKTAALQYSIREELKKLAQTKLEQNHFREQFEKNLFTRHIVVHDIKKYINLKAACKLKATQCLVGMVASTAPNITASTLNLFRQQMIPIIKQYTGQEAYQKRPKYDPEIKVVQTEIDLPCVIQDETANQQQLSKVPCIITISDFIEPIGIFPFKNQQQDMPLTAANPS